MSAATSGGDDGFTILELIVCLGLLALIAALSAQGLALVKNGHTVMSRADSQDLRRAVEMHIRRAIERAAPLYATNDNGEMALVFTGEPKRLRLVTRSDGRIETGGLVLAEFRTETIDGEPVVVTERRPLSSAAPGEEAATMRVLHGVDGLSFRYYGKLEGDEAPGWRPDWANAPALPGLIEVEIAAGGSAAADSAHMVVAVPAAQFADAH